MKELYIFAGQSNATANPQGQVGTHGPLLSMPMSHMIVTSDQPPLAVNDIHLNSSGYAVVGERMAIAMAGLK